MIERSQNLEHTPHRQHLLCTDCRGASYIAWGPDPESEWSDEVFESFSLEHALCDPNYEIDILTGEPVGQ